jgi:hypothetical protein
MDPSVTATISAASGFVGAAIGGGATFLAALGERRAARQDELQTALLGFLYALDALHLEIGQLPRRSGAVRTIDQALANVAPSVDYLLGQLSRHTLGRPAMRALDRFVLAQNRLLLVAPPPLMHELQTINELLSRTVHRDNDWNLEWGRARERLQVAARELADDRSARSRPLRFVRRRPTGVRQRAASESAASRDE